MATERARLRLRVAQAEEATGIRTTVDSPYISVMRRRSAPASLSESAPGLHVIRVGRVETLRIGAVTRVVPAR